MSTEWDDLIKDLAVLNGTDKRDQEYKNLCAGTALINLWSILENDTKPTAYNLHRLRELLKEHEPDCYEKSVVPKLKKKEAKSKCTCGLYQTCGICKKYQER